MITVINGCVFIPHPFVWQTPPVARRIWETEITEALLGAETRQAMRAVARRQIIFTVTAATPSERSRLDARVAAALKSGLGCAPLHGRTCFLGANLAAGANSLTLAAGGGWNWQTGDYVALLQDDQTFDVLPVTGVAGLVLSLAATAPAYNWPLGALAWPVVFGAFTADKEAAVSGMLAQWKVTVTELVSGRSAQIGATPAGAAGIGDMKIEDTPEFTVG